MSVSQTDLEPTTTSGSESDPGHYVCRFDQDTAFCGEDVSKEPLDEVTREVLASDCALCVLSIQMAHLLCPRCGADCWADE